MKKIAIFNDYQLPLPAVKGGSVPTLTTMILEENERLKKYKIDVFSSYDEEALLQSKKYTNTRFFFSKQAKVVRFLTNLSFKTKINFVDLMRIPLPFDAKRQFKANDYDLVYINGYIRGAYPIIKSANGAVIVHHQVVTDLIHEKSIIGEQIINEADTVCFDSDFARKFAQTGTQEQNQKMIPFPNAIYTERFKFENAKEIRKEIRDKHNISDTDILVIFVGRMVESKGCIELIRAFNNASFGDSVKLMIIGGATYSSTKVTPYVNLCLEESKPNKNIILTGYIAYEDLPQYYKAADISTLISRCNEACGLVGIESMAAGLPVITTNRGGIGEYVTDDCKIITPDDENLISSIEQALKTLVADKDLRKKMGEEGKKVAQLFTKEIYFKTFCDIVESTCEKRKAKNDIEI